ncbi:unnamed protein product [Dovyalis caffra]|uniref:Uncharacterized protein n=1 Tax=Dovyalis caffra TaxID=77055 RepID=A0AAV1SGQ0_9ROSI|nr:unnamed protein product [Dovyalis caffra]
MDYKIAIASLIPNSPLNLELSLIKGSTSRERVYYTANRVGNDQDRRALASGTARIPKAPTISLIEHGSLDLG